MGSIREARYAGMNAAAEVARTRGYPDRIILALMRQPGKIVREYAAAALEFPQHAGTIRNQGPAALARCCQSRGPFAGGMIEYLLTKAPSLLCPRWSLSAMGAPHCRSRISAASHAFAALQSRVMVASETWRSSTSSATSKPPK